MLIDWLTLRVPVALLNREAHSAWERGLGWVMCIDRDGHLEWRKPQRQSVRSDSHQVMVEAWGNCVKVSGSPCRVAQPNNVFGSSDIVACARSMLAFADAVTGLGLSGVALEHVQCTRVDITKNYDLQSPARVRQALNHLRHAEGGRFQVRTESESVYWGIGSKRRSGKAYHKGPQLRKQVSKGKAFATESQLAAADRLLRLEMQLSSEWFRERPDAHWCGLSAKHLDDLHTNYFTALIGNLQVATMDDLLAQLRAVTPTEGQALAAYRTWSLVKALGVATACGLMPRSTWLRHRKALFDCGLSWADLQAGNVVPIRFDPIVLGKDVGTWQELGVAA